MRKKNRKIGIFLILLFVLSGMIWAETQSITVYVTKTGSKYHTSSCRYLKHSKIPISLESAKAQGYDPCSVCNPTY